MIRIPPTSVPGKMLGRVEWTTAVAAAEATGRRAKMVWRTTPEEPTGAELESLYLQLERQLAVLNGEPMPAPDRNDLPDALAREAKQYQMPAAGPVDPLGLAPKRWTTPEAIDREFGYHPATEKTGPVHNLVRELLRQLAHQLNDLLPECPRKTEAIGHLRTAMWAANSAVAAYGGDSPTWVPAVQPTPWYLNDAMPWFKQVADPDAEAKRAYHAYGAVTEWKNHLGFPMPDWNDLGEKIQQAWRMAAATAFVRGRDSVAADFQKPNRPSDQEAAEAVFQAIGTASVCWEDMTGTGVFNDRLAAQVGNDLLVKLGFTPPEGYRPILALGTYAKIGEVGPVDPVNNLKLPEPEAGERESSEPE